jgi:hypothetical protein
LWDVTRGQASGTTDAALRCEEDMEREVLPTNGGMAAKAKRTGSCGLFVSV